ncbi:MAG: hypothetical protein EU529_04360 [Promethearchaeota archaeon]|nr:MAG: hypothetical protein EU529_04360 [Candidatus Lokiarchaeota archaeon]
MVDIGGPNLPKSVSSKLGTKLGKIYKKRKIKKIEPAIKKSLNALGELVNLIEENENKFEIQVKHKNKFCPIGGKYNPTKAEFFQESICIPFYIAFLNRLDPRSYYNIRVKSCVVSSNTNYCIFELFRKKREK